MNAAFIAFDFWVAKMYVAFVLKKVEMTPNLFCCIVNAAILLVADRADKLTASSEINEDMQFSDFFIECNIFYIQWFFDSQGCFKKL